MKKFFIVISLFLILISSKKVENDFTLLDYFSGEYSSYTETAVDVSSINLGFCFKQDNIVEESELVGESLKVVNFEPMAALKKLKANIVKTEYLEEGITVFYAYTSLIKDNVDIDDKKVNIQIAHKDDYSVIGWPLILGSF